MNLFSLWALVSLYANPENLAFWMDHVATGPFEIRINAIQKLAEIKAFESIPVLEKALQSDNAEIRYHSARALGRFPTDAALKPLQAQAAVEKDVYVKSEINRSLNTLKDFFKRTDGSKATEIKSEDEILE